MAKPAKAIGAFFLILAITLALFELVVRQFAPAGMHIPFIGDRYMFITPGAYVNHEGFFNYAPQREIREIAYYPDIFSTDKERHAATKDTPLSVEYDCSYHSDALGFLNNGIAYKDANILLLGDSVSEGEGGCSWLPALPDTLKHQLYSTATMGQGIAHWKHIVDFLEPVHHTKKLVIIFISGDFFREAWLIDPSELACLSGARPCYKDYVYPIAGDLDAIARHRHLLRILPEDKSKAPPPMPPSPRVAAPEIPASVRFCRSSMDAVAHYMPMENTLASFFQHFMPATASLYRGVCNWVAQDVQARDAYALLQTLARDHDITLIRVNTKDEAVSGNAPNGYTRAMLPYLKHFDLHTCLLTTDDFLPRDGHPNAQGYAHLRECVQPILEQVAAKP